MAGWEEDRTDDDNTMISTDDPQRKIIDLQWTKISIRDMKSTVALYV